MFKNNIVKLVGLLDLSLNNIIMYLTNFFIKLHSLSSVHIKFARDKN